MIVRPVRVSHEETVEIQWRFPDGTVFWQRYTVPPQSVREAVEHDRAEMDAIRQQALGLASAPDAPSVTTGTGP